MTSDQRTRLPEPLDLKQVKVLPLASRRSLSRLQDALVDPDLPAPECPSFQGQAITACADRIRSARDRGASVMLIYGAHLVKNGLMAVVNRLLDLGVVTHLATNGAGTIHDWEFSYLGRTEESVRENVATGTFGTWDETGRNINLALLAGALRPEGYGGSLGRFIAEDGVTLPSAETLKQQLRAEPEHPLAPARADLLQAMLAACAASRQNRGETPQPNHLHPCAGFQTRGADDRPPGHRLRHHHHASHVQRRGDRPGGGARFRPVQPGGREVWTAAWCCRSDPRSWDRRSLKRA